MKFIYLTDLHLSYLSFKSRLDEPTQTGLDKVQWVLSLAESNGIDKVILGGDIFNASSQQVFYMNRLIQLIKTFKHKGIEIYTVAGNHDVASGSFETLKTSALGILTNTDLITLLGDLDIDDGWLLRGCSAYERLNLDQADRVRYLVIHGSIDENIGDKPGLIDNKPSTGGMYYLSSDLKKLYPNLRVIFSGHLHHETAVHQSPSGVLMVNPGSMFRCSSAEENRRIPKVCYVDTSAEVYQLHPIAIAQPYESIFNLEAKSIRKSTEFELGRFMSLISSTNVSSLNIDELIRDMLFTVPESDRSFIKADLIAQGFTLDALPASA